MRTATAVAHPNIALVKYWGKRDVARNLPAVPSLSLTLDRFTTTTTVSPADRDEVVLGGAPAPDDEAGRVLGLLDRLAPDRPRVRVVSANNFPSAAGLASSASAFAALALAGAAALRRPLDRVALSVLARQGSGSACRSLWGGFVEWRMGERDDGADSHGVPVAPADHWDVRMVVGVVSSAKKAVGSTTGMTRARTSPYWPAWEATAAADVAEARAAVLARDLERLGAVMERSTFKMHATTSTAASPFLYWQANTVACVQAVWSLRERGVPAWVTMDAGPNVKVLCAPDAADAVSAAMAPYAERTIALAPGGEPTVELA